LRDPSGVSLYEAWLRSRRAKRLEDKEPKAPITAANVTEVRVGSGSDHTVFLNFVGLPVMGLQFDGPYGVYHSMYDDHFWIEHFGDPGFRYHALMSQLWGVLALRLANADALPFDFGAYGRSLRDFVNELQAHNKLEGQLDLAPLLNAIAGFEHQGDALNAAVQHRLSSGSPDARVLDQVNRAQMQVEANWLHPDGIPGRPWFKHMLYGARYTYAHLELPGLTEAVESKDWPVARQHLDLLLQAIGKNTGLLRSTAGLLRSVNPSVGHSPLPH
jgi:N-acetylated-alpha-linked acidic dipeptidase